MSNPSNHMEAFDDESVWKVDILAPDVVPFQHTTSMESTP